MEELWRFLDEMADAYNDGKSVKTLFAVFGFCLGAYVFFLWVAWCVFGHI